MSAEYNLGSLVNAGKSISEQNIKRDYSTFQKISVETKFFNRSNVYRKSLGRSQHIHCREY